MDMSTNLFEAANHLETVFRESNEYKSLQRLCAEVSKDPQATQIFNKMNYINPITAKTNDGTGNQAARSGSITKNGVNCPAK